MSQSKSNYITKETKKKFDNFIQDSINKFFFVDAWDELYEITGENHYQIISNQSTIPDLVIYNKQFNKNICFLYSSQKNYVKFPRKQFILRPIPLQEYNPSCTIPSEIKNKLDNTKKGDEIKEDFVFKSIPKELELKFNSNPSTQTKNNIFDELKEFMDNKNDKNINNINNVNNINNNQQVDNVNNTNTGPNNNQNMINNIYNNNLGSGNNMINFEGKDFEKMRQKIMYDQQQKIMKYQQFLYYRQLSNSYLQQLNNNNNLKPNKFNQFTQMNPITQNLLYNYNLQNNQNNLNNQNNQNIKNNNMTSYYNTENRPGNWRLISDLNEIVQKNKNGKNWLVKSNETDEEKISCNSQELYYFLHNALNNNESLDSYKVIEKEFDMFCDPKIIYEALKSVYQKEKKNNEEDEK